MRNHNILLNALIHTDLLVTTQYCAGLPEPLVANAFRPS
jgi:hypothetical protein